jgi:hypothetical protein
MVEAREVDLPSPGRIREHHVESVHQGTGRRRSLQAVSHFKQRIGDTGQCEAGQTDRETVDLELATGDLDRRYADINGLDVRVTPNIIRRRREKPRRAKARVVQTFARRRSGNLDHQSRNCRRREVLSRSTVDQPPMKNAVKRVEEVATVGRRLERLLGDPPDQVSEKRFGQ